MSDPVRYFKLRMLDDTYAIVTAPILGAVVIKDLTEAEADAYLKLLKED